MGLTKVTDSSHYKFNVAKIVTYLKKYSEDLPNLYVWNVNIEKLVGLKVLTEKERDKLSEIKPYEKEIILKDRIRKKLNEFYHNQKNEFDNLCLWIIKDWGGITGAKDENTIELIKQFLNQNEPIFNRIASASKVGAYMFPEKYTIYDSRVTYSLNWIILSENAGEKFFPIPEGRNSKMSAFDMNVLIRLRNIQKYKPINTEELTKRLYINNKDKSYFIPTKKAYSELNKLIKDISSDLWEGEKSKMLYYTEMLLFSIADKEIFNDITSKLTLSIK
ncbi:hypothetical protein BZG01_17155 [Labilibaculum manganireducens]|uniref:Uncharacterized protein n=1 Tax=Labilibaculum manganireducens TaxID=1940525 RepID=A0A2N3HX87_9BACT|nr:hypothetical protein BZG01_17155 [Labilibaculum manganireducens]